jgi:hypothetical protein
MVHPKWRKSDENGHVTAKRGGDGWPRCAVRTPADCELICHARKRRLMRRPATNWHDGQITQTLSSPSDKNIPLNLPRKSVA